MMIKVLQSIPLDVYRKVMGYFGLAALFFMLSFITVYSVHHYFSEGQLRIPSNLLSANVIGSLAVLLVPNFLADGLLPVGWRRPGKDTARGESFRARP